MVSWTDLGGHELEPALRCGSVRLVDARFIVELSDRGQLFERRQNVPDSAFLSLEQLQQGEHLNDCLRIISVSHPWLTPDHPDPRGENLRLLAATLRAVLRKWGGPWGVFIDFMSLHQKVRTAEEQGLFAGGLRTLSCWYSHPRLTVVKITKLPRDYPTGLHFPAGSTPNTADYYERGWCYCESSVSNLVKPTMYVWDLGQLNELPTEDQYDLIVKQCALTANRPPPLLPSDFAEALATKAFTSKKADLETVSRLYQAAFGQRLGAARVLNFKALGWGDSEVVTLAGVLSSGATPKLNELHLSLNPAVGDKGMQAIAAAIRSGNLPGLSQLSMGSNRATEEGQQAVTDACDEHWVTVQL